jgi:CRP/FNR family transcriptional regulator, cyclic AMP receptor protein
MKKLKETSNQKLTVLDSDRGRLIENITEGKELRSLKKGTDVFSLGTNADSIYYILSGRIKITATPFGGKGTALSTLEPDDFFGEGCLFGHVLRTNSATAVTAASVVRIEKEAMLRALRTRSELCSTLIPSLVVRTIDLEANLCSHLFTADEKRLAHVLLKLHRYGGADFLPSARLSQVTDATLAKLAGTTIRQTQQSLRKFKNLGLIVYVGTGEIIVNSEMMTDMVLAAKPSAPLRERISPRFQGGRLTRPGPTKHSRTVASLALFETVRKDDRQWTETQCPGIRICNLFDDVSAKHGAILVRMEAGAIYPDHQHKGREQFYVIEGDVRVGTDVLYAGDYHRAEASTYHRQVSTEGGCVCIILGYVGSITAK